MPITIQPTTLRYKDENGVYRQADCLKGEQGYSPTATVANIEGGHRLSITDTNGTTTIDVMDGEKGEGITEITVNDDGTLTITYGDGESVRTGSLKGDPGHTPVRGTDYWTAADKAEIVTQAVSETEADLNRFGLSIVNGQLCVTYEEANS